MLLELRRSLLHHRLVPDLVHLLLVARPRGRTPPHLCQRSQYASRSDLWIVDHSLQLASNGLGVNDGVEFPHVLLPLESERPLREIVHHVGACTQRFVHFGNLEDKRLFVFLEAFEIKRDLALVPDTLISSNDARMPFCDSGSGRILHLPAVRLGMTL